MAAAREREQARQQLRVLHALIRKGYGAQVQEAMAAGKTAPDAAFEVASKAIVAAVTARLRRGS